MVTDSKRGGSVPRRRYIRTDGGKTFFRSLSTLNAKYIKPRPNFGFKITLFVFGVYYLSTSGLLVVHELVIIVRIDICIDQKASSSSALIQC